MYLVAVVVSIAGVALGQDFLNPNSLEEVKNFFNEKCIENNEDATKLFSEELISLNTCLQSYLNFTQVQEELQEARESGLIDEFVKKYCDEYPRMYHCLENAVERLRPCLSSSEEDLVRKSLEFVERVEERVCYRDGLQVALFIATEGIECMQQTQEPIQDCINGTFENPSINTLSDFLSSVKAISMQEQCSHLTTIRSCFRRELLKCKRNIPANVVDSFFKFFKGEMSCKATSQPVQENDGYFLTRVIIGVVYLFIVAALCYKLAA